MTAQLQLLSVLLMVLAAALMIGGVRLRARKRWRIGCRLCQYLIAGLALLSTKAEAGQILYVTNSGDNTVAQVDDKEKRSPPSSARMRD